MIALTLLLLGVGSMVQLKSRELLVGSGSGTLSLVRDSSAEMTRDRRRGVKTDGAPRVVAEPTKSCLNEVGIFLILNQDRRKFLAQSFADQVYESPVRVRINHFPHPARPGDGPRGNGLRPNISGGHADVRHCHSFHLPHEQHLGHGVSQVWNWERMI